MHVKPINKKAILVSSLISIIAGILIAVLGYDLLYIFFIVIGALALIGGILSFIRKYIFGGIIGVAIGVLLIIGAEFFVPALLIVNGVLLCVFGIYDFAISVVLKDFKNLIFSILTVIVGVFFFLYTEQTIGWIFFVIGALFIALGIVGLITSLFSKKDKKVKEVDVKDVK